MLGLVSLKRRPVNWKAEQGLDIQSKVPYLERIVDALMRLGNWIVSIDDEVFFSNFISFKFEFSIYSLWKRKEYKDVKKDAPPKGKDGVSHSHLN